MEQIIKTAEQLIADVTAYIEMAKESQVDRLTAIAMNESLTKLEKQVEMTKIATEKFDAQAIISNLKAVVTFEGSTYELPKRPVATKTVPTNTAGKPSHSFQDGDRVKYVNNGIESAIYTIKGGKLVDESGAEFFPKQISDEVVATVNGMSLADYKTWHLAEHGRAFTGVAGLSDTKHWVKVLPEATN